MNIKRALRIVLILVLVEDGLREFVIFHISHGVLMS